MQRPSLFAAPAALALVLALGPAAASDLWLWTDAEGHVRYTPDPGRVPVAERGSLARVESGMTLPGRTAAATEPEPALLAPADEIDFSADPFNAPDRASALRATEIDEPASLPREEPAVAPLAERPAEAPTAAAAVPAPEVAPAGPPESPQSEPETVATAVPVPEAAAGPAPQPAAPEPGAPAVAAAPPAPTAAAPEPPEVGERRAELEAEIAEAEEAIKQLISSPEAAGGLQDSPELAALAERLPALQAELRALDRGDAQDATEAP